MGGGRGSSEMISVGGVGGHGGVATDVPDVAPASDWASLSSTVELASASQSSASTRDEPLSTGAEADSGI